MKSNRSHPVSWSGSFWLELMTKYLGRMTKYLKAVNILQMQRLKGWEKTGKNSSHKISLEPLFTVLPFWKALPFKPLPFSSLPFKPLSFKPLPFKPLPFIPLPFKPLPFTSLPFLFQLYLLNLCLFTGVLVRIHFTLCTFTKKFLWITQPLKMFLNGTCGYPNMHSCMYLPMHN